MNVDCSIFKDLQATGMRSIIRDDKGEVVVTMISRLEGLRAPLMAEATALRQALVILKDLFIQHVEVEIDCLQLAQACHGSLEGWATEEEIIIAECKQLMSSIPVLSLTHVPRTANKVAHNLARHAQMIEV